jgi:hypothetical protein
MKNLHRYHDWKPKAASMYAQIRLVGSECPQHIAARFRQSYPSFPHQNGVASDSYHTHRLGYKLQRSPMTLSDCTCAYINQINHVHHLPSYIDAGFHRICISRMSTHRTTAPIHIQPQQPMKSSSQLETFKILAALRRTYGLQNSGYISEVLRPVQSNKQSDLTVKNVQLETPTGMSDFMARSIYLSDYLYVLLLEPRKPTMNYKGAWSHYLQFPEPYTIPFTSSAPILSYM